jgi:hypothetical protein
MIIRVTEGEIKRMIAESVNRLLEFDESFMGGFDEGFSGGFDETAKKRPAPPERSPEDRDVDGDTSNTDMERKRNVVLDMFSNDDEKSNVKRRGAIELLYHPKDDGEWDTYRSEFSKYLDPDDTAHVWKDSQINKLYNWLSDIL